MNQGKAASLRSLVLFLLLAFGWNYWLPTAKDFFNHVTPANEYRPADLQNIDFHAYYTAGQRYNSGKSLYVYGNDPQGLPIYSDYIYPPTLAPVLGLIARLSYDPARILWLILYGLCYLGLLAWMAFSFPRPAHFTFLALALLLTLVSFPLLDHILKGQADVFIICLILGSFLAYASGRRLLSATLLAVATVLKVSPVFLLFYYLIFQRDWRFLILYAAACLLLVAASLFFVPPGSYLDYGLNILPQVSSGTATNLNQSLLRYLAFSPSVARLASIGGLSLLAVLIWLLSRRYPPAVRRSLLPLGGEGLTSQMVFILNLAGILIFVGKAWPAAYVWLILPTTWLLAGLIGRPTKPAYLVTVSLAAFLVSAKNYGFPIVESLNLWGNLLLVVCLAFGALKPDAIASPDVRSGGVP
jgi:hypothetical protein